MGLITTIDRQAAQRSDAGQDRCFVAASFEQPLLAGQHDEGRRFIGRGEKD
jgi:hypothetical protein